MSAEREESAAADKALLGSERDFFESHADELQLIFALMKSESEGLNEAESTELSLMTSEKIELTRRYHEEWGSIHPESKNRG